MSHTNQHNALIVRGAHTADAAALAELAALDSGPVPQPPALVAEVEGRLLAALPLDGGPAVADPFAHTAELVELLRLRAGQLGERRRSPRLALRLGPAFR